MRGGIYQNAPISKRNKIMEMINLVQAKLKIINEKNSNAVFGLLIQSETFTVQEYLVNVRLTIYPYSSKKMSDVLNYLRSLE